MAEEPRGLMSDGEAIGTYAGIIAFLLFVSVLLNALAQILGSLGLGDVSIDEWFLSLLEPYLVWLYLTSFVVTVFLIAFILYCSMQISRIIAESREQLEPTESEVAAFFGTADEPLNPRWERIEEHMASDSQGEWRVAILEADIILEEMLEAMGYHGDSIGDRLKQIEKSDFTSLDSAWEAHKVRNQIAHEGSDYNLTAREARRVIDLYRSVFEEFRYI